jgi:hypothetical protein
MQFSMFQYFGERELNTGLIYSPRNTSQVRVTL